ncbi:TIGR00341 family protein [Flavobacterium fluviatile]|uniref:TIGR00341 family protein n=1 Tax=Flavobacterium fluviatile TaxID=1862387 RepID=UPI0013CF7236|nr:TIGR00341 family protein [Flavobacterium fluviatile]
MINISTLFSLHEGEDNKEKTLESVKKNIDFKGANIWILACAIIVASIGLNVNSTAVIIGAMLISPLMGPIVGAGFALGIYDFSLLKKSLKNLLNATLVSLLFSTVYFYLSPFKDVQSELLARTSPNIYDILIAFFGGLVGVIAVTRTEKGNPIPGVAIATALMPPLCTAGYGIATLQWTFFLGAFYLYCINCVFIGISTFLIVKYLKYPAKQEVNKEQQRKVKIIITLLITVMILPSSYLAYTLYEKQQFRKNVDLFIEKEFTSKGYTMIYKKTDFNPKTKMLELAFLSKRFNTSEKNHLKQKMNENQYLKGTNLIIKQDSTDRFNALKGDILNQIKNGENEMNTRDLKIIHLEKELAKYKQDNIKFLKETRILFPEVSSLSISEQKLAVKNDSLIDVTSVIYDSEPEISKKDKEKFKNWLNQRLAVKNVILFRKQD